MADTRSALQEIRCPDCHRVLAEACHDTAILNQGGRIIVVREIISIQCEKCRGVFVPRMAKPHDLEIGNYAPTPKMADVFSTETMLSCPHEMTATGV